MVGKDTSLNDWSRKEIDVESMSLLYIVELHPQHEKGKHGRVTVISTSCHYAVLSDCDWQKNWCTSDFLLSHQFFPVLLDVPRVVAHDLLELGIPLLRILRQ
jgi:hypothetical protein